MVFPQEQLQEISASIDELMVKISEYENRYAELVEKVHPHYANSARNLVHYLALRSCDMNVLHEKMDDIGLPNTQESLESIVYNLIQYKIITYSLMGLDVPKTLNGYFTNKEAEAIVEENRRALFGTPKNQRQTAIMITQPKGAATDHELVRKMVKNGMDCARVNCGHDDPAIWSGIIDNIRSEDPNCKIMMDLGGPKVRTGPMKPGRKLIKIKPTKDSFGEVTIPAKIWLAPYGTNPPEGTKADTVIPVNKKWLQKTKPGSYIEFRDAKDRRCKIIIDSVEGRGRWAHCFESTAITPGMFLNVSIERTSRAEIQTFHRILPLEVVIFLFPGDFLRLDREPIPGAPAEYHYGKLVKPAHISCILPEIFEMVSVGDPVFINDGKIAGRITEINSDHLMIEITGTKKKGGKLRANKGINFPESNITLKSFTEKDKADLKFVAEHADVVEYSFVNTPEDVDDLLNEMQAINTDIGIILKIETRKAFKNLPVILLKSMQHYPVGVMIARGDLAIETGWKNFAVLQEEVLQMCEAAHLPTVWATQVLESLTKKGVPTRAEITDAAMAQRADCVMLNKGIFINRAIKMLDQILTKMQRIQWKKKTLLPKMEFNEIFEEASPATDISKPAS